MTNPDELERAVERLEADMTACGKSWLVAVHKADQTAVSRFRPVLSGATGVAVVPPAL